MKYSSLGIQLLLVIGVSGWLGWKVDRWLHLQFPVFLLLFVFASFGGMMYQLYRSLNE
ncbi:MAG: AtpZ/AtpI family protein [Bacteroidetes bacterium]|nr:AtpZ/AtpI family protein [Bacteroidota bacterium]MBS1540170.1 AtpZ/AtpI family protein [Bacteroidota bacterium]